MWDARVSRPACVEIKEPERVPSHNSRLSGFMAGSYLFVLIPGISLNPELRDRHRPSTKQARGSNDGGQPQAAGFREKVIGHSAGIQEAHQVTPDERPAADFWSALELFLNYYGERSLGRCARRDAPGQIRPARRLRIAQRPFLRRSADQLAWSRRAAR